MLLKQTQVSVTRPLTETAQMDCIVEDISHFQDTSNFQRANMHWYLHKPSEAPKRILHIASGSAVYDDNSYRNKYSSSKKGKNTCTFSIHSIDSNDEGTYYCAYSEYHRTSRPQADGTKSCLCPKHQASCQRQGTAIAPSCL